MVAIKSLDAIAAKFVAKASAAGPDYEAGVRQPRNDYARNTLAAETSYDQGVTAAIGRKSFGKGVQKAGTGKWQAKSLSKGVTRYGPGVADAKDDFQSGFTKSHGIISALQLPAKRAKGDPGNIQRVAAIAKALRDGKTAGGGA